MTEVLDPHRVALLSQEVELYWDMYCSHLSESYEKPILSDDQIKLCVEHLLFVLEENKVINLTRIIEPHDAVILHILDSLTLLPFVNQAPAGLLLDVGTGAGFPGLTLAIACGRKSVLMDSVGKKVKAVQSCIDELGVSNASAIQDRVESYALEHFGEFAVVVARAVAPLAVLIEYASPLLMHNGLLVVTKGTPDADELLDSQRATSIAGFAFVGRYNFDLPGGKGERSIFVYKKSTRAKVSLPRQVGMAKKHPLGSR